MLGGSWVVISRVLSRATIRITHIRGLITLLITTLNLQVGFQSRGLSLMAFTKALDRSEQIHSSAPRLQVWS